MFLRIRRDHHYVASLEGNPKKRKSIHGLKAVLVCVEERKKINSFEITVIIFKAYEKCKSPIEKGF